MLIATSLGLKELVKLNLCQIKGILTCITLLCACVFEKQITWRVYNEGSWLENKMKTISPE